MDGGKLISGVFPAEDKAVLKRWRLSGWAMLCIVMGTLLFCWFFDHLGRMEVTLPFEASIAAFWLVIKVKWRLRQHPWFWTTLAVFLVLHVVLLFIIPWTKKWVPGTTTAGVCSIDVYAMLAAVSVVGRLHGSEI